ncbi:MAG: proton-conducting transporter membrane subunit [Lachnospiraceae bacterium]|nr:proton-conducting transporter membrane subunit [Lachnospiraceae bacterium]
MNRIIMFAVILLPIIGGSLIPILPFKTRQRMMFYIEALCVINSVLVCSMLFYQPNEVFTLFRFSGDLSVTLHLDGPGKMFCALAAIMWPFAVLYSFEYMKHEEREKGFFMFYIITYGITLGVALSENILTMYFFFEMMSLVTLPLVMHTHTREAILASRTYLYFMLGGAAFAFIGMVFILSYGTTSSFLPGGIIDMAKLDGKTDMMLLVYVFSFFGFGIKTAIFPFGRWLPKASVAPTPVTALLHAVAVVNTGAFAVMRITYYSFGTNLLRGTWAQDVVMLFVIFTIVYGCSRAVKETHLKRRLAWSTVSNLSYILFGVVIMTPEGACGALCHMLFHSFMKITSFFCAGAIIYKTGKNYVHELNGFGKKMPKIFCIFTVSAMALMGVPGLAGFISKWSLARAAFASENILAYVGVGALLVSALLTAIYMLTICVRAFFPGKEFDYSTISDVKDPNMLMIVPLCVFLAFVIYFGIHPQYVLTFLSGIDFV